MGTNSKFASIDASCSRSSARSEYITVLPFAHWSNPTVSPVFANGVKILTTHVSPSGDSLNMSRLALLDRFRLIIQYGQDFLR